MNMGLRVVYHKTACFATFFGCAFLFKLEHARVELIVVTLLLDKLIV